MKKIILFIAFALSSNVFAQPKVLDELECKNQSISVALQLTQNSEAEANNSVIATVHFLKSANDNVSAQILSNTHVNYSSFREVRNFVMAYTDTQRFPQSQALMTLETKDGVEYSNYMALHGFVHELKCVAPVTFAKP